MFHFGWNTVEQSLQGQQPVNPNSRLKGLAVSERFMPREGDQPTPILNFARRRVLRTGEVPDIAPQVAANESGCMPQKRQQAWRYIERGMDVNSGELWSEMNIVREGHKAPAEGHLSRATAARAC
jgi:hypothetical protein